MTITIAFMYINTSVSFQQMIPGNQVLMVLKSMRNRHPLVVSLKDLVTRPSLKNLRGIYLVTIKSVFTFLRWPLMAEGNRFLPLSACQLTFVEHCIYHITREEPCKLCIYNFWGKNLDYLKRYHGYFQSTLCCKAPNTKNISWKFQINRTSHYREIA